MRSAPFPVEFLSRRKSKVQCGFQRYCHFYQQVYRSGTFSPLDSSQMAVTDVQLYGKLFLRKPVGFAGFWIRFPVAWASKYISQPSDQTAQQPIATPRGQSAGRHSFAAGRLLAGTGFVLNQSSFHSFSSSFPLSIMAMLWGGAWRMHGAILHDSKRKILLLSMMKEIMCWLTKWCSSVEVRRLRPTL